MGFTKHITLTCHTCKRRYTSGGPKKTGSFDDAKRVGWTLKVRSTFGEFIWLCPTCTRKHASTELPLNAPRKKRT